ncbi:MAG: hypothetical protein EOP85_20560 [Verrucomicrobiaceae bacterium]|nr:MAG: hypothetical protein EOP85_20560 [Verrucomicrobiaceae bacterium]
MKSARVFLPLFLATAALSGSSQAGISIYLSPNGIETAEESGITNVTTETFNNRPTGSVDNFLGTVGTYTTPWGGSVENGNIYSGATQDKYLGIQSGSSTTLTLTGDVAYFGLYFSAGDGGNSFDVKNNGATIFSFNTAALIAMLPRTEEGRITAINGQQYKTRDYYGQPGTGHNGSEPYAYIHIIGTEGTTFDQIVLSEAPNTAIFENDNHSIRTSAPELPDTLVHVSTNPTINQIPEPSAALIGGIGALLLLRRRRA